ncbi:MAG: hypothetical protein IT373_11815 [Polyangiaceae bacterium]|nr:hypothetical protein [Polyangiaceae bacterium]
MAKPVPLALGLCAVLVAACSGPPERKLAPAQASAREITIELSAEHWAQFPCTQCHEKGGANTTERPLTEFHTNTGLRHGSVGGWCYRCHSNQDPDKLHLTDGTLLPFEKSYELCSGCHGDRAIDWRAGTHGLNVGYWNGPQTRRTCTLCHNPHRPAFAPMQPEKAPNLPRTMAAKEGARR